MKGEETRELEDPVESGKRDLMFKKSKFSQKRKIIALVVAVIVIAIIIAVVLVVVLKKSKEEKENVEGKTETFIPPLPTAPPGADGPYSRGVVAADAPSCSEVGRNILKKNGSAVDSAVATLFCIGVINMHSAGIGGGGFMVIYSKARKDVKVYDYREEAPGKANQTMYVNSSLDSRLAWSEDNLNKKFVMAENFAKLVSKGPSASGIPGEIKGFHAAWKQYGRLPWKELVQPAIDFARNGFLFGYAAFTAANRSSVLKAIEKDEGLSQLLLDGEGNLKKLGSVLKMPKFAKTLETIRDNPESFYTGELAKDIVKDIQENGGIITLEDMKAYKVVVRDPLTSKMGDYTWYTNPPPGSGAVLSLILNILKGYNMTGADRKDLNSSVLTYHRAVEAFKFAYAYRALLGDEDFWDVDEIVKNMTDTAFGESLRQKIHDDQTFLNFTYYGDFYSSIGIGGTSSMSVISPDGDAVAATNTINLYFGSKYRSTRTGIIYNNEMDDFSTPGTKNYFGVEPSASNFIEPFKRPMSSMTPTIFLDKEWVPRLVVGASGGTKITTAISLVVMNYFWFNQTLSQSVIEPRVHHQLLPMYIRMDKDYPMPLAIQEGLQRLGHEVRNITGYAVVQAAATNPDGKLYGKADPRKYSWAAGF